MTEAYRQNTVAVPLCCTPPSLPTSSYTGPRFGTSTFHPLYHGLGARLTWNRSRSFFFHLQIGNQLLPRPLSRARLPILQSNCVWQTVARTAYLNSILIYVIRSTGSRLPVYPSTSTCGQVIIQAGRARTHTRYTSTDPRYDGAEAVPSPTGHETREGRCCFRPCITPPVCAAHVATGNIDRLQEC